VISLKKIIIASLLVLMIASNVWAAGEPALLTNADVIEMVKAGLDVDIIIAKIINSPVDFDTSTKGLIDLKNAHVPSPVVSVMIKRPKGPVPLNPRSDIGQTQTSNPSVKSISEINSILIKAPTEAIRATAESIVTKLNGPTINPDNIGYDAILIIGIDAGEQTLSWWTGANYCTAIGSIALESGGKRIWIATDKERSANSAKASQKMTERMVTKFVKEWQAAKGEK
jgi:hypothetical protein